MSRPAAVIVLAAGQGTRMKSALPKVVHPLAGLSMIGHALRAAQGLDPENLVAVVRHQREVVAAEIARVSPNAIIADQDEIPGTGRAVQCGLAALDEAVAPAPGTIVVTYGDVPLLSTDTLADLVATHEGAGHAVTVLTSRVDDPTGYGRIIRDASGTVTAIVEQRDATPEQAALNQLNPGRPNPSSLGEHPRLSPSLSSSGEQLLSLQQHGREPKDRAEPRGPLPSPVLFPCVLSPLARS